MSYGPPSRIIRKRWLCEAELFAEYVLIMWSFAGLLPLSDLLMELAASCNYLQAPGLQPVSASGPLSTPRVFLAVLEATGRGVCVVKAAPARHSTRFAPTCAQIKHDFNTGTAQARYHPCSITPVEMFC
jgi:hypothetical protein